MKTLKSRIRTPFLVLFLVVLLSMHGLFNLGMLLYMDGSTKAELKAAVRAAEPAVNSAVESQLLSLSGSRLQDAFTEVETALAAAGARIDIEMLYYNRLHEPVYPAEADALLTRLIERLPERFDSVSMDTVYTMRVGGRRYFLLFYPMTQLSGNRPTLVFAAQASAAGGVLGAVNLILFVLIVLGAGIAVVVSGRVAARLARPVTELYDVARSIGSGDFAAADKAKESTGVREMDDLNRSIREMAARLEASDRAQKTFMQNAAHELKTPLMSIQGYAEGISHGVIGDTAHAASVIADESRRLDELVRGLLELSRLENPAFQSEPEPTELAGALRDIVQRLGGLSVRLSKKLILTPTEEITVMAGGELLSQAVMNIASNGLRYAASRVEIRLIRRGPEAVIRISDDGPGIAQEDLPHLFERFYRGKNGNFGLGLAIAKSAAERMGGAVTARNGENGAVFEIRIPLIQ